MPYARAVHVPPLLLVVRTQSPLQQETPTAPGRRPVGRRSTHPRSIHCMNWWYPSTGITLRNALPSREFCSGAAYASHTGSKRTGERSCRAGRLTAGGYSPPHLPSPARSKHVHHTCQGRAACIQRRGCGQRSWAGRWPTCVTARGWRVRRRMRHTAPIRSQTLNGGAQNIVCPNISINIEVYLLPCGRTVLLALLGAAGWTCSMGGVDN